MESWRDQPVVFWTFLLPGALWLLCFFLAPLALVWLISFGERAGPVAIVITGTLENYIRAFDPIYLGLLWKSFWIAAWQRRSLWRSRFRWRWRSALRRRAASPCCCCS